MQKPSNILTQFPSFGAPYEAGHYGYQLINALSAKGSVRAVRLIPCTSTL